MQFAGGCLCVLLVTAVCSIFSGKIGVQAILQETGATQNTSLLKLCESGSFDTSCVNCFCNGFSDRCEPASGWYQARVSSSPTDPDKLRRFSSNGLKETTADYLSVQSSSSAPVFLSFPPEYLGDRRTAYGQTLSLTLSLAEGDSPPQCQVTLELESGLSFRTRHTLRTLLSPVTLEPSEIQIPLVAGNFIMDRFIYKRVATSSDVRRTLADIRVFRLVLACKQPRSLRLHASTLSFATTNSSDTGPALQPLEEVGYVEQCSCPSNRIGANCEGCADGYTVDPPFAGEFALCVRCFCSYRSATCHPMSGECRNCTGNTMGAHCEQCVEGYARAGPLSILPCDRCAPGYFESGGDGQCTACDCHVTGSVSSVCNRSTGVCECGEGFTGDQCDSCSPSSGGTFPNCQPCDECTTQWDERITSLEEQVGATIDFIVSLNLTNETSSEVSPEIESLLRLVTEIRMVLDGSMIDSLAADVNTTHSLLCSLLDRTHGLLERALQAQSRIQGLEEIPADIAGQLELIALSLLQLEMEFQNISLSFAQEDFSTVDFDQFLQLARLALERSNSADALISENVTTLLTRIAGSLDFYNDTLVSSDFQSALTQVDEVLVSIDSQIQLYREFIAGSNDALCGANDTVEVDCSLECGGVSCSSCGGDSCISLYSDSVSALNSSLTAVAGAERVLLDVQEQLDGLQSFLAEVELVQITATRTEGFANETRAKAAELLGNIQTLTSLVQEELNRNRVNVDNIGSTENTTLSLQHDLLPQEFLELLIEINATIASFQPNTSVAGLRRRVEEALRRALNAEELARVIVTNATLLEDQLTQLMARTVEAEVVANDTQQLVEETSQVTTQAVESLDSTEELLESLTSLLAGLDNRLDSLQTQVEANLRDLATARNLTTTATRVANQTEAESLVSEGEYEELRDEAQGKYDQSTVDLQTALDIQNRTVSLQRLTQDQLLQLENLERIRNGLFLEQEEVRADVTRVANELQTLDENIRVHIARNTACLDTGILSKRRRRKRKA